MRKGARWIKFAQTGIVLKPEPASFQQTTVSSADGLGESFYRRSGCEL